MKNIEKYLNKNRELLDVESPDDTRIWKRISVGIQQGRIQHTINRPVRPLVKFARIAALIFILFSVGYITKDIIDRREANRDVTLSDISETLGRKEKEYRTLVTLKTDEVKAFSSTDNLIIRQLFGEIKKLDVVYDQSLKDLKEKGYNEKIVNTIFDTYEKKIHLLELIILESNKLASHENIGKIFI